MASLSHTKSITVDRADVGMRLDAFCGKNGLYPSRSAAAKAVDEGKVLVNGKTASKKLALCEGDTVVYELAEEEAFAGMGGEDIKLDIRYEDDDILVISKQAGLVCHPSHNHHASTLVNALIHHCGADHLCNIQGDNDRLGIVHRLDQDTTGLMVCAKTNEAGEILMDDIRARAIDRHYIALVHGIISHDTGMIDVPILRDQKERTKMSVSTSANAREALTTFKVLERFEASPVDDGYTLLECKLFTGRTHQIRVHMQYINHPVVGDPLYVTGAPRSAASGLGLDRQFLHSYNLKLEHPRTDEELSFYDNVPKDLACALDSIGSRSTGLTENGKVVMNELAFAPTSIIEGAAAEDER
ncbi:MAG: RluA family pseudouridine synthase [Eggerthellaceae bacterium]|nr:RluA family pseudouridine synthase [Eggerthellaceae bacterium]